jgi:putative two-component system response regulator
MIPSRQPAEQPAASELGMDPAQLERVVGDLARLYRERNAALQEVSRAHHEALFRLALAAEMRDDDTGVHIVRMGFGAEALARALGCDPAWASMLRKAAPMHDIGKIGIPDHVLKKPGSFTPDERAVMNQHAALGADILGRSSVPLFALAAEVAMTHHERWDGQGYPLGLSGDAIPLSGRIVAVADFMDALTMDRCYRPAFTDEVAVQMLAQESGRLFDPHIVQTYLDQAERLIDIRDRVNTCRPSFLDLADGSLDELIIRKQTA